MKKSIIDTQAYRKQASYARNQEIWKLRFQETWTLRRIANHLQVPIDEVKSSITTHKQFFEQEYD